jgi:hypothetical protein
MLVRNHDAHSTVSAGSSRSVDTAHDNVLQERSACACLPSIRRNYDPNCDLRSLTISCRDAAQKEMCVISSARDAMISHGYDFLTL